MTGFVIDVGCMTYPQHPEDESVHRLVERFHPAFLHGFDPHPDLPEGVEHVDGTIVCRHRVAVASYTGTVKYTRAPAVLNDLRAFTGAGSEDVNCVDLATVVLMCPSPLVLKLDCEGAEYDLIPYLEASGAMERVDLLLVEFHGDRPRPSISVPWEEW